MNPLQRFEQRLETVISGVFARAFRSAVQPVEIAAALQRECDNNAQVLSRQRRLVPNDFHVELSATDLERIVGLGRALEQDLVDQLQDHADAQGYVFTGPDQHRLRVRRRPDHRPLPDPRPRRRRASPTTTSAPAPAPPTPPSRSTAPATRCARPAWSSAAAPRPTCGSTTPA